MTALADIDALVGELRDRGFEIGRGPVGCWSARAPGAFMSRYLRLSDLLELRTAAHQAAEQQGRAEARQAAAATALACRDQDDRWWGGAPRGGPRGLRRRAAADRQPVARRLRAAMGYRLGRGAPARGRSARGPRPGQPGARQVG